MSANRPLSDPQAYVEGHREDLLYLLHHGGPFVRGLALYVLVEGAESNDWELVEREIELAQEIDDDILKDSLMNAN